MTFLAKIALELRQAVERRRQEGTVSGAPVSRLLAQGDGWSVEDLLCTCGRHDLPFEERHTGVSVAIVMAGTFEYRAAARRTPSHLMTAGSLLLGNPGQAFECSHEHGAGDRCLSFHFAPEYFENIASDAGAQPGERGFRAMRLPLLRELSPVVAHACGGLARSAEPDKDAQVRWEEIGLQLAALSIRVAGRTSGAAPNRQPGANRATLARVTRAVRHVEENPAALPSIRRLALEAGLSPYHFLRVFEQITGVTPHRHMRRLRLRRAAAELLVERKSITDVVMECGFGDVSNFNHAFRSEFGMSPKQFRRDGLILTGTAVST